MLKLSDEDEAKITEQLREYGARVSAAIAKLGVVFDRERELGMHTYSEFTPLESAIGDALYFMWRRKEEPPPIPQHDVRSSQYDQFRALEGLWFLAHARAIVRKANKEEG